MKLLPLFEQIEETHGFKHWPGSLGWRVDFGFWHEKGTTAGDVIRHERRAGNDYNISKEVIKKLDKFPPNRLIWYCMNKSHAIRYGSNPESYSIPPGSLILGDDGDNGYLVLLGGFKNY